MKILFINDCNGNEYSNPYTDLVETKRNRFINSL